MQQVEPAIGVDSCTPWLGSPAAMPRIRIRAGDRIQTRIKVQIPMPHVHPETLVIAEMTVVITIGLIGSQPRICTPYPPHSGILPGHPWCKLMLIDWLLSAVQ